MNRTYQKGIVHIPLILILLAALGILVFILFSSALPFKDQLFSRLFPKPPSFAATCTASSKNFETTLNGSQEVPPTSSTATATIYMYLDPTDSTKLNYSLLTSGLPVSQITAMHIHSPAGPTGNAPPTVTLYDTSMGAIVLPFNRTATLPASVLSDILAGNAYVNVHTNSFPNGEIRGQLTCSTSEAKYNLTAPTSLFSVGQEIPVDVKARTDTDNSGSFQAGLKFDPTKLEVSRIDTASSFISLWAERLFDNTAGTVTLTGGVANPGFKTTGADALVATVVLKVKTTGASTLSLDYQKSSIMRTADSMNILANQPSISLNDPTSQRSAYFTWQGPSSVGLNQVFTLDLMARSDVDAANLFAGKFTYPSSLLEVVSIDTTGSFVTNWVEQTYDNATGKLSIIGGLPNPGLLTTGSNVLMAKVTFRSKTTGNATINNDSGAAIYRNSDNIDILDSSKDQSFTVNITTASPSPTPTPTATPTPSPTPTPTPTPTPSPTPTGSPTPSPSGSPPPTSCVINSATWNSIANPVNLGTIVYLKVIGNSLCDGKQVRMEIREDDGLLAFDPVRLNPKNATFPMDGSGTASTAWVAEWQEDCAGLCNPPEYYFLATIVGDANSTRSSDPLLQVVQLPPGTFRSGDGNHDGKVDLTDVSMILTNWNRTSGFAAELDINVDGVINTGDFSSALLILFSDGLIKGLY